MVGFADGFKTGFGLMEGVKDREFKEKRLDEDMKYRADTDAATAEYRAEDLRIKGERQKSDASLAGQRAATAAVQANTAATNAEAALVNANTAASKQADLTNPESIEYKKGESEIAENEAQTEKYSAEAQALENQQNRFNAALNVSQLYELSLNSDGMYDSKQLERIEAMYQANKGSGFFNLGTLASDVHQRGTQEISGYMADVAAGLDPVMSDSVARAFTTQLAIDSSAAVGRQIDQTFVNAPEGWKGRGYQVKSQGLFDASMSGAEGNLNGELFVEIANKNDPDDVQFYFPPLTSSRSFVDSKPLDIKMEDIDKPLAGSAYLIQQVGPEIKPAVKQARIKAKFGDDKGDNGVDKFEARVAAILESNRKAIQNGSNTNSLIGGGAEFAELTRQQQLSEPEMAKMKRRIEEQILFGAREEPTQTRARKWLSETYSLLESAPTPNDKGTLGSLIKKDQWSPQLISALAPYYDKDDDDNVVITDPVALTAELVRKGYL